LTCLSFCPPTLCHTAWCNSCSSRIPCLCCDAAGAQIIGAIVGAFIARAMRYAEFTLTAECSASRSLCLNVHFCVSASLTPVSSSSTVSLSILQPWRVPCGAGRSQPSQHVVGCCVSRGDLRCVFTALNNRFAPIADKMAR
jgi:hypothetical protein